MSREMRVELPGTGCEGRLFIYFNIDRWSSGGSYL